MYNTSVLDSVQNDEKTCRARKYSAALVLLCVLWLALRHYLTGTAGRLVPAIIGGGTALAALPLMDGKKPFKSFLLACLPYALLNALYFFSDAFYPGDTFNYHYPVFQYTAEQFAHNGTLTDFFPVSGGLRTAAYHVNLFPFSPFRLFGIALGAAQIPPLAAYKIQLFAGMLVTALGWWLVLLKATGNIRAAFFGLLAFLPGGATFTMHQEQALLTMHIAPWFVLSLLLVRQRPVCGPIALFLLCSGLAAHYPQIQVIALPLCAWGALLFCGREYLKTALLSARKAGAWAWLAAALAAAIALLPMLYMSGEIKLMGSPMRQASTLNVDTVADYLRLNSLQESSKTIKELGNYLWSSPQSPDSFAFSCGRPALLAGALAAFIWPGGFAAALLAALFMTLTLGINTPIPEILFKLHVPFFSVFRQWYHFFPFANLALSLGAAVGFKFLLERFATRTGRLLQFSAAALIFLQATDSTYLALKYADMTQIREKPVPMESFIFETRNIFGPAQIMQYSSRKQLADTTRRGLPQGPSAHDKFILAENGGAGLPQVLWAEQNAMKETVLDISLAQLQAEDPQAALKPLGGGLWLARLSTQQLLVLPFNYDMRWWAENNRGRQPVYRADGALSAFFAAVGDNRVSLKPKPDGYPLAAEAASGMMFLAIGMLLFCVLKEEPTLPS